MKTTLPLSHPDHVITEQDHLFTLALCEAGRRARAAYPGDARLIKGLILALNRQVTLLDHGADVASQFGDKTYHLNGACPCPDARHHQGVTCKHRYAVALTRKALAILAQAERGATGGTVCPQCGHASVQIEQWGRQTWQVCRFGWQFADDHADSPRWASEIVECGWRVPA